MYRLIPISFALILLLGCTPPQKDEKGPNTEVYQYSIIKALLEGGYDGNMTLGELAKQGDFGIGTFNTLDGEMVVLDGKTYQVKTDGVAYETKPDMKTPFAVMTHFEADTVFALNGTLSFEALLGAIDKRIPAESLFYAIRIDGEFKGMKTRSVRAQSRPYRPLGEVVSEQSIFSFEMTEGSMAGFRFPAYTQEINVPGHHFHYLDEDRKKGGHVLALEEITATVYIDFISNLHLELPQNGDFHELDLTQDRTEDLEKVEKLRN